jgi:hypothetical protein
MRTIFDDDQRAFRESARTFVVRHLAPTHQHQKAIEERRLPREV